MDSMVLFYGLLLLVAFLYAAVGHGGASGYLALMALWGVAPDVMKPTALVLNLFVSLTSFIQFYRSGHFRWQLFWPFAVLSVPMAFVGGSIKIDAALYKQMLGVLLLIPVARLLLFPNPPASALRPANTVGAGAIGAVIGFLSGLIGIGGGILLSPVVLLLRWADQKQTAAISALFIFVNSVSGLMGQVSKGLQLSTDMIGYIVVAFAGGLLGAWLGAGRLPQQALKYVLALVLLVAVYKLIFAGV